MRQKSPAAEKTPYLERVTKTLVALAAILQAIYKIIEIFWSHGH
jgi:hypothetical protein